jgi:hypothetical protein
LNRKLAPKKKAPAKTKSKTVIIQGGQRTVIEKK